MAKGFKSTPKGISVRFTPDEAELLRKLAEDVVLALEPESAEQQDPLAALVGINETAQTPSDPAVARLLPAASDDPEIADEYRKYTDLTLRQQKISNLQLLVFDVVQRDLLLDDEHAHAWAAALNDIRLVIGSRLGLETDADAEQVAQHTSIDEIESLEEYMSVIYNFLTWLQDTLMEALLEDLERGDDQ